MNNILLIIQREYLTRVRKKSFIVMTILGPLLIGIMYAVIIWAAISSGDQKKIVVLDKTELFTNKFKDSPDFSFSYIKGDLNDIKSQFKRSGNDALVYIPGDIFENPSGVQIFAERGVSLDLQMRIENSIESEIETIRLTEAGITKSVLESAKINVKSETINLKDGGEKRSSAAAATVIGFICAFMIYISVFIYGAQVMRGIMEEKTSRIVEVIISSVKPFQLMIGKIIGVALVGLTQFVIWISLTIAIYVGGQKVVLGLAGSAPAGMTPATPMAQTTMQGIPPEARKMAEEQMQNGKAADMVTGVVKAVSTLPVATIIVAFLFYFLGGYLLYSALFGAVGSAVDSDTDTQQFMLPITIPIIASFIIAQLVVKDPNGSLGFWTSMIPFTSPIIMMVRIPFGVPAWQIILSIVLLIGGFIFTTWVAARIYRVGILMYGKKVTWKEMTKWIFYKG